MMPYIKLMDDPAGGTQYLDGLSGKIAFLAGIDRPQAMEAFDLYRLRSIRPPASFDAAGLRVVDGETLIQWLWETNISTGQDVAWTTVWTGLAVDNRLHPEDTFFGAINAIISEQRIP